MDELIHDIKQLQHTELYHFYRFYQKHLIMIYRLGKPRVESTNDIEQRVLKMQGHQEQYSFDKWFRGYVKEKGFIPKA